MKKSTTGLYGENPVITIGKYTISEMCIDEAGAVNDKVWVQLEDEEGAELNKSDLEPFIAEFFNKYF